MLLRVDTYPGDSWETRKKNDSDNNNNNNNKDTHILHVSSSSGAANTFHVSAGRQKHGESGTLLTVGRKNADVILTPISVFLVLIAVFASYLPKMLLLLTRSTITL